MKGATVHTLDHRNLFELKWLLLLLGLSGPKQHRCAFVVWQCIVLCIVSAFTVIFLISVKHPEGVSLFFKQWPVVFFDGDYYTLLTALFLDVHPIACFLFVAVYFWGRHRARGQSHFDRILGLVPNIRFTSDSHGSRSRKSVQGSSRSRGFHYLSLSDIQVLRPEESIAVFRHRSIRTLLALMALLVFVSLAISAVSPAVQGNMPLAHCVLVYIWEFIWLIPAVVSTHVFVCVCTVHQMQARELLCYFRLPTTRVPEMRALQAKLHHVLLDSARHFRSYIFVTGSICITTIFIFTYDVVIEEPTNNSRFAGIFFFVPLSGGLFIALFVFSLWEAARVTSICAKFQSSVLDRLAGLDLQTIHVPVPAAAAGLVQQELERGRAASINANANSGHAGVSARKFSSSSRYHVLTTPLLAYGRTPELHEEDALTSVDDGHDNEEDEEEKDAVHAPLESIALGARDSRSSENGHGHGELRTATATATQPHGDSKLLSARPTSSGSGSGSGSGSLPDRHLTAAQATARIADVAEDVYAGKSSELTAFLSYLTGRDPGFPLLGNGWNATYPFLLKLISLVGSFFLLVLQRFAASFEKG